MTNKCKTSVELATNKASAGQDTKGPCLRAPIALTGGSGWERHTNLFWIKDKKVWAQGYTTLLW